MRENKSKNMVFLIIVAGGLFLLLGIVYANNIQNKKVKVRNGELESRIESLNELIENQSIQINEQKNKLEKYILNSQDDLSNEQEDDIDTKILLEEEVQNATYCEVNKNSYTDEEYNEKSKKIDKTEKDCLKTHKKVKEMRCGEMMEMHCNVDCNEAMHKKSCEKSCKDAKEDCEKAKNYKEKCKKDKEEDQENMNEWLKIYNEYKSKCT